MQEQRATIAQLEQELVQQRTQIEALASGLQKSAHSLKRTTLRRKWSTIPNEKEILEAAIRERSQIEPGAPNYRIPHIRLKSNRQKQPAHAIRKEVQRLRGARN